MLPTNLIGGSAGPAPFGTSKGLHLVEGGGGARAVLAGTGALLPCALAGLEWETAGGASGGSIPTLLLSAGWHPAQIAHLAIETDFSSLLTRQAGLFRVLTTYFLKDTFYRLVRPRKGLCSNERMGAFIAEAVRHAFPEKFWTVAAEGSSQWLFTHRGITIYSPDGTRRQLTDKPAPIGIAIRSTAAIPGVFNGIEFENRLLFDGALSVDGRTPIGPTQRHFGAVAERTVAVDFGEDATESGYLKRATYYVLWRILCGEHCPLEGAFPVKSEGTVLIKPDPTACQALQFSLPAERKMFVLMSGFEAAVEPLAKAGLLTGSALDTARSIVHEHKDIRKILKDPALIVAETERLLKKHGLY